MATPELTRRERKKEELREALLDAALALFVERGYATTTVEDIAARVDVAPRTFFRYFPNKAALLRPASEGYLDAFQEVLHGAPADEPLLASIRRAMRDTVEALAGDRDRLLLQHRILAEADLELGTEEFANLWTAMEAHLATHLGVVADTDARPALVTGLAVGLMKGTLHQWLADGATADLGDLLDQGFVTLAQLLDELGPLA